MYNQPFFVRFAVDQKFDAALREAERSRLLSIDIGEPASRGSEFLSRWLPSKWTSAEVSSRQSRPGPIPSSKPQEQCC